MYSKISIFQNLNRIDINFTFFLYEEVFVFKHVQTSISLHIVVKTVGHTSARTGVKLKYIAFLCVWCISFYIYTQWAGKIYKNLRFAISVLNNLYKSIQNVHVL